MQTHVYHIWSLRVTTFLLAALAAASAAYWVLKGLAAVPAGPQSPPVYASVMPAQPQLVARLLGGGQTVLAAAQAETAASRFKLTGVVANRAKGGVALISVEGKPAKPYRVGERVNDALVLQSVAPRSASLAANMDAPASFTLDLPALARSEARAAGVRPSDTPTASPVTAPAPAPGPVKAGRVRSSSSSD